MRLACTALLAALLASSSLPAAAATRGYSVVGFERIRVEGPYAVTLKVGPPVSATAIGDVRAIDRLRVEVQGRTLLIRTDPSGWGGWQGESPGRVAVNVTVPVLTGALLSGSGALAIDGAKAMRFDAGVSGSGTLAIGALAADRLTMALVGSGTLAVAGHAAHASATLEGSGGIDAAKLATDDLDLAVTGSGDARFAAARTAKISATGSGNVIVTGAAACTVNSVGSGDVRCGRGS